jgi:hypothetical protein
LWAEADEKCTQLARIKREYENDQMKLDSRNQSLSIENKRLRERIEQAEYKPTQDTEEEIAHKTTCALKGGSSIGYTREEEELALEAMAYMSRRNMKNEGTLRTIFSLAALGYLKRDDEGRFVKP